MKDLRIFNEEGLSLSFAKRADSGIDVYSNELILVFEGIDRISRYHEEITVVSKEYARSINFDPDLIEQEFCRKTYQFLKELKHKNIILVKIFFKYMTGTRVILPQNADIKAKPKSSKSKNAPYLDSLQNCDGVVDQGYRGIIQLNYELNSNITRLISKELDNDTEILFHLINLISNNVYLPSLNKAIGQLVPEHREDFVITPITDWKSEYEDTDRGTGGHGSTGR